MENNPLMINASEMGTGKTETALAAIEKAGCQRVLIACPSKMVLEWRDRVDLRLGERAQIPQKGNNQYRLSKESFQDRFLIINHEMLRAPKPKRGKRKTNPFNYLPVLEIPPWDAIIVDEAHRFKNPKAAQTIGLHHLFQQDKLNVPNRIHLLSGTMFLNYPDELWTNLNLLYPEDTEPYEEFRDRYCIVVPSFYGPRVVAAKKKMYPELRERLAPLHLRREKRQVLPQLPPKMYRPIPVELDPQAQRVHDDLKKELFALLDNGESIRAKNVLSLSMRLRQITLEPKLLDLNIKSSITDLLLELESEIPNQIVIYSWFASYLKMLEKKIENTSIIVGGQSDEESYEQRKAFQDKKTKVMLISIGCAIGIDLTTSNIGIFTDRFWVPKINEQAEDRLDRIGQTQKPLIIDLVAQNTIAEHIIEINKRKSEAFNETLAMKEVFESMRG
jgi:SNF2 family DNA or RNA helicase